jgi:hypothetical protein
MARAVVASAAGAAADHALAVLGEAGIGKTALLADLTEYAQAQGLRVVSAAGRDGRQAAPLDGLRQLLRTVPAVKRLTEARAALGTSLPDAAPDLPVRCPTVPGQGI